MKVGVNTQVWTARVRSEDLELVGRSAEMGYQAIELGFADRTPTFDLGACCSELEEHGLVAALCGFLDPARDISSSSGTIRRAGRDYLIAACRSVRQLGGTIVCGPLYAELFRARDLTADERAAEWKRSVGTMREVATAAEELGVIIAIEPLNRFETDLVTTAEQALAYVEEVDSPAVGVHLDTFHMNIEERSLPDAIRRAGDRLVHFHACENDRGIPGSAHVDWTGVRQALDDVGYDELVVFEGFNRAMSDLANGARIWRDLGGEPDAMAAGAADYLLEWVR